MTALLIDSPWAIGMIVLAVLLLFGGSRLAGLGKSAGRAIKEFKDETAGIMDTPQTGQTAEPNQPAQLEQASQPVESARVPQSRQPGALDQAGPSDQPGQPTS